MTSRRLFTIPLLLALGVCLLIAVPASADVEPNDSLLTPETIGEGTYNGTVYINTSGTDVDYYKVSIPSDKDLEVTITKTDTGPGSISVESYDENRLSNSIFGIWITLTAPGETKTQSDYNGDSVAVDYYLEVSGDGDYEMIIKFTDETAEAFAALGSACMIFTIILVIVVVIILGAVIFFIIFYKKKQKKERAELSQMAANQAGTTQTRYLGHENQPMQPAYPPQGPPPQQFQQGYPPQAPAQPPQQMMQQPAAPPAVPPGAPPQQPATPPPQQPAAPPTPGPQPGQAPTPPGVPPQQ